MDFDGYEPLSLTAGEIEMLKTLRRMADENGFEYGIAASCPWVSEVFTSYARNYVDIPANLLEWNSVSLYHAHTNQTLLSSQDLRLLLRLNVEKVCVIAADNRISCASVGSGDVPDDAEFEEIVKYMGRTVDLELLDNPVFFEWTPEERIFRAVCEQSFRIARHFKWRIEGGHYGRENVP